jgi:hypothetical protein
MADSRAFEWTCAELEAASSLTKLESRGTIRLAVKEAGLESDQVTPQQMGVVVERVLPGELRNRGVEDAEGICGALTSGLRALPILEEEEDAQETPEDVFKRLSR